MSALAEIFNPEPKTRSLSIGRHKAEFLRDATHFQTDADTFNGLWVIETLRRFEDDSDNHLLSPLYEAVEQATGKKTAYGRRRLGGRFELAYLAFVFSRHA